MKVRVDEDTRLTVGGWSPLALLVASALAMTCVGMIAWMLVDGAWNMIFVVGFTVIICGAMLWKLELKQTLTFDADTAILRIDNLGLRGREVHTASIGPESRIEIESYNAGGGKPTQRRMVFVDGVTRMPLSRLHQTRNFDAPAKVMNDWLDRQFDRT